MNNIKKDEIKYLKKKYKIKLSDNISLEEFSKLKRELFISELSNKNLVVTNNGLNKNTINYSSKRIHYTYSYLRFDSNINYLGFVKEFYNIKNVFKEKTFFTNCGMSTISAILLSLQISLENFNMIFPDKDIYFETYDFYNKFIKNKSSTKKEKLKIIYIDSICKEFDFERYQKIVSDSDDIFAIIFDTTCFDVVEMQIFINKIASNNIFCIFLRSHTKLDMMASEISSLGSLSFIIPKKVDAKQFDKIKKIITNFYYLLGKFGSLCTPDKFPEFIFEKEFKKLNFERICNLKNNNINLYNEIKTIKTGHSILPTHKKFVLFVINDFTYSKEQRIIIENKIRKFVKSSNNINYACSFGFDYVAIDSYYDINEENYVIRISMNDDIENIDNIKLIKEFLNDNF